VFVNDAFIIFQRKAKYTDMELELLVQLIEKYKLQLYGSFSSLACQSGKATTNKEKCLVWGKIATEMRGSGYSDHSESELKRKKESWFCDVKKKVNLYKDLLYISEYVCNWIILYEK